MEMMNENALPEDGQNYISQQKDKTKKLSKKKQIFTRDQRHILKKWFISHADNPYLKDHSKLELSQKTGLQPRQISNWFTNVRKRIWQPIKNKNQNKSINDLILKVKLRLESDLNSESDAEF
jgi:CRISPR/Cas system CMR-associated protein Cmr1 (group 7 of RAMP superfamily)